MTPPLPCAIYLRVSSDLQVGADRYGLSNQEHECRAYATRAGLRVAQVYTDVISGVKESRDGLQALLRDAGAYSAVVVFAVDRLARSVPLAYALLGNLQAVGLAVHSAVEGPLDLEDDTSALGFGIRAVIADQERRRITKRMYGGKLAKVRAGQPVTTINAYGWKDGQIDEEQAHWVRWIFGEVEQRGIHSVAFKLTEMGIPTPTSGPRWSMTTVRLIIKNPLYKGIYEYGRKGERLRLDVAAIVTPEQWARTNGAFAGRLKNRGRAGTLSHIYQLQGVARCTKCGSIMSAHSPTPPQGDESRRHRYYFCRAMLKVRGFKCDHRTHYPIDELHQVVRAGLHELLSNPAMLQEALERGFEQLPSPQLDRWAAEVKRLDAEWERWKGALRAGAITPEELAVERRRIDGAKAALGRAAPSSGATWDTSSWTEATKAALEGLSLNEALRAAGITVLVSPGGAVQFSVRP